MPIEKPPRLAPAEIQLLAFGVRYEPHFRIMDQIGTVVDEILRADGTPFGPDTFQLTDQTPQQYRLFSDTTNSWLLISAQDAILQMTVNTRDESRIDDLAVCFQEFVLGQLRGLGVKNIARYGVMFRFAEEEAKSYQNPPTSRFPDLTNANAMIMNVTQRLAAEEALAMKRVNDFRNAIYSVRQTEAGKVQFSIDYQEYFDPLLDAKDWDERPFPRFVGHGTAYMHGEFNKWLQKFAAIAEVA